MSFPKYTPRPCGCTAPGPTPPGSPTPWASTSRPCPRCCGWLRLSSPACSRPPIRPGTQRPKEDQMTKAEHGSDCGDKDHRRCSRCDPGLLDELKCQAKGIQEQAKYNEDHG